MTSLADFKANDNKLTGPIPEEIYALTDIFTIYVHRNDMSGTISNAIGNLTELDNLRLFGNRFSGTIPASLGPLEQLDDVQLYDNDFTGRVPLELCPLQRAALNLTAIPRLAADCLANADGIVEVVCELGDCCSHCCDDKDCVSQ